jgi:uncharacterized protein (DUF58 family)
VSTDSTVSEESTDASDAASSATVRATGRWRGGVAVVLLAAATGLLAKRPSLLLVAAVGVALTAYPRLTATPTPTVSLSREIESAPDDRVAVTTTITNTGDETLFDCRVIDGVPPMLSVVEGSPRCATTLPPGGTATLSYELAVRSGGHRFQPTTVLCRDAGGSVEVETTIEEPTEITAAAELPTLPIGSGRGHHVGRLPTEQAGEGIEFHSVDRYEPGDPIARIDWRRFARTGELTTVAFRTAVTADVLICVDTGDAAYRAASGSEPHAVAHAVDAAERIADALFAENHRVGLAAVGGGKTVLPPAGGREHAARLRHRLRTDPAFSLSPPPDARPSSRAATTIDAAVSSAAESSAAESSATDTSGVDDRFAAIEARCEPTTQLVVITPACDDTAIRLAHRFGSRVTVISPDVTTDRTAGGLLARAERADRLSGLRNAGVPVVDWDPTTPLGATLATADRRQR